MNSLLFHRMRGFHRGFPAQALTSRVHTTWNISQTETKKITSVKDAWIPGLNLS